MVCLQHVISISARCILIAAILAFLLGFNSQNKTEPPETRPNKNDWPDGQELIDTWALLIQGPPYNVASIEVAEWLEKENIGVISGPIFDGGCRISTWIYARNAEGEIEEMYRLLSNDTEMYDTLNHE